MALIDEAKTWLRVSTDDEAITAQIQMLIDSAKSDLTETADVNPACVAGDDLAPLVKNALFVYVSAMWTDDDLSRQRLMVSYNDLKAKLAISAAYSTYSEG